MIVISFHRLIVFLAISFLGNAAKDVFAGAGTTNHQEIEAIRTECTTIAMERDALLELLSGDASALSGRFEKRVIGSADVAIRASTLFGAGRGAFAARVFASGEIIGTLKCKATVRDQLGRSGHGWIINVSHTCLSEQPLYNPLQYMNSIAEQGSCISQNVRLEKQDHSEGFFAFATKPIRLEEELFADYGHQYFSEQQKPHHVRYVCGLSQLHSAAARGDTAEALYLIEDGRSLTGGIDQRGTSSNYDWTPLMEAAASGHSETVDFLLQVGADLNAKASSGETALFLAASRGHVEVVRILLAKGANVDLQRHFDGATPLSVAAQRGDFIIAELLVQAGSSVNQLTNALFSAAEMGDVGSVRVLLHIGANPRKRRKADRFTPLFLAVQNGHVAVVQLFLDEGLHVVNDDVVNGVTLLMVASMNGHFAVASMLLVVGGANVHAKTDDGATALFFAAQHGHVKVVKLLSAAGGSISVTKKSGAQALHVSSENGHTAVVKSMLNAGVSPDVTMARGATALLLAAQSGHADIVNILASAGADADRSLDDGTTPLILASQRGHSAVISALLDAGADIRKARNDGATPLVLAIINGNNLAVSVLQKELLRTKKHTKPLSSRQGSSS